MAVNGILGIKLGMTQFFADDGESVPCTVLQAGPCVVVPSALRNARRLRSRSTGAGGIRQAAAREQAHDRAFQEGECAAGAHAPRSSACRSADEETKVGDRVLVDGFENRRICGCDRREQGHGICGRRQALALSRRRRHSRLDVSPRAGRHRRQLVSFARVEGAAFPRDTWATSASRRRI